MPTIVRSLLLAMVFAVVLPLRADPPASAPFEDYLRLLRIDLRATKAKIVAESLELSPRELEIFLPAYSEYDGELGRLNIERINLLREYAAGYTSFSEAKARDFTQRSFEHQRRRLALLEKCSRRLDRELSPIVAARFAQVEQQLLMLIDVQIASELPLPPRGAELAP